MQNNCQKIDDNKKPIMVRKATEVWFTFRLMLLSYLVTVTALVYVLFFLSDSAADASKGGLLLMVTLGYD